MRIGIIVGKDDEFYEDDFFYDITPKKYYQNGGIHTDVAVAMTIKQGYPDVTVDIILPNQVSLARLKKNNVNFILGYDCINQILGEPYVKKFAGPKGYDKLKDIYSNWNSRGSYIPRKEKEKRKDMQIQKQLINEKSNQKDNFVNPNSGSKIMKARCSLDSNQIKQSFIKQNNENHENKYLDNWQHSSKLKSILNVDDEDFIKTIEKSINTEYSFDNKQ